MVGVAAVVVDMMEVVALDIDEPADIEQLKTLGRHTRAYRELVRLGLIEIEKTG